MTLFLSQVSASLALIVANAAPRLTAIRVGPNRHVTGFLWRSDMVVTADQALPAASSYSVVLANGGLTSARQGPRDPMNNLAAIWLDSPVTIASPAPARGTTIGALVLALGADYDGSPTVRLTTIYGFPRIPNIGTESAVITLDLAGNRASQGGMVIDAEGLLLGMTSVSAAGETIVVPHAVVARFAEAAAGMIPQQEQPRAAAAPAATFQSIPPPPPPPYSARPVQSAAPPVVNHLPDAGRHIEPVQNGYNGHANDGLDQQKASGRPRRGWLGVSLQPITVPDGLVARAGQHTARQVVSLTRGGPADRAGLRSGDVLLALDGNSTSGNHALRAFLAPERIGTEVEVRLMRDGMIHTAQLVIAAQPDS